VGVVLPGLTTVLEGMLAGCSRKQAPPDVVPDVTAVSERFSAGHDLANNGAFLRLRSRVHRSFSFILHIPSRCIAY
jgi:hypothetical protein